MSSGPVPQGWGGRVSPRQRVVEAAGLGRRSATRVMTSVKEARGAKPFRLQVSTSEAIPAQCQLPACDQANSAFSRIRARGRLVRSTMFETVSNPPVIENEAQSRPADRLGQLAPVQPAPAAPSGTMKAI